MVIAAICLLFTSHALGAQTSTPADSANWNGYYVGIHGGYGWGGADYTFAPGGSGGGNLFSPDATGGSFSKGIDGGIFGGHIGLNHQVGCFVAGLEASADWSDLGGTATNLFAPVVVPNTTYETKLRWLATVTPRFGYAVSNWLFYMKGGLAAGSVDSTLAGRIAELFPAQFLGNQDHIGWTMGTGIEYLFCRNWIIGLEYNYYDLGTQRYGGEATPNTTFPVDYTLHPSFNTVLARVSYKFW